MPSKTSDFSTSDLLEALVGKLEQSTIIGHERHGSMIDPADMAKLSVSLPRLQTWYLRAQNGHARINRLPIEVLAHIFDIAKELDWGRVGDQHSGRVVRMSLVCQHWRGVALTFPGLWASIHLRQNAIYDFQFAALCLERSKHASLRVIISTLFRGAQIAHFFAPHAFRIVEVTLHMSHRHSAAVLPSYVAATCSFPAPNLRSFNLCIPMWGAEHPPPLPPLFGAPNSSVTHLHIESFATAGPAHGFRKLTHLALTSQGQHAMRGFMANFLKLLKANRALEELLLDDAGPALDTSYPSGARIILPRMRLVYIQTACVEPELPARLLDHLALPNQCSVRVHRATSRAADATHSSLVAFPSDTTHIGAFASIDSLTFKAGESLTLSATARHADITASYRLQGPGGDAGTKGPRWIPAAVDAFLQVIPRTQVRSLWLAMSPVTCGFGTEDCRRVVDALSALEELTIVDDRMADVVGMLSTRGDDGVVLPAPGLITLRVLRMKRDRLDELLQLGEERRRLGHPIQYLTISLADLESFERDVESLKGCFHTVKVIGLEAEPLTKEPDEMVYTLFGQEISLNY